MLRLDIYKEGSGTLQRSRRQGCRGNQRIRKRQEEPSGVFGKAKWIETMRSSPHHPSQSSVLNRPPPKQDQAVVGHRSWQTNLFSSEESHRPCRTDFAHEVLRAFVASNPVCNELDSGYPVCKRGCASAKHPVLCRLSAQRRDCGLLRALLARCTA